MCSRGINPQCYFTACRRKDDHKSYFSWTSPDQDLQIALFVGIVFFLTCSLQSNIICIFCIICIALTVLCRSHFFAHPNWLCTMPACFWSNYFSIITVSKTKPKPRKKRECMVTVKSDGPAFVTLQILLPVLTHKI